MTSFHGVPANASRNEECQGLVGHFIDQRLSPAQDLLHKAATPSKGSSGKAAAANRESVQLAR